MKFVARAFWISLICLIVEILICGVIAGTAEYTGNKYQADFFIQLGINLGVFFTLLSMVTGIAWVIMKITMRRV
ncbi:hypothetical protein [Bacillus badius]|uniref:Uncharacterized protein n=1 Tax=Bacillus badius TaxID=1455 RepID=A0ABR5AZI9_BACBA|nr:hypothetical protein [Bacillus badius]KIL80150.1 hypothetical protein SD77_2604 [Bacillus badius]MED4718520.1 hypothetical protein [Bacillus badius]